MEESEPSSPSKTRPLWEEFSTASVVVDMTGLVAPTTVAVAVVGIAVVPRVTLTGVVGCTTVYAAAATAVLGSG
jgi:hypothetical protein